MQFEFFEAQDRDQFISARAGETKLGEKIQLFNADSLESLATSSAQFVLFGVPEDIGPRANCGNGGADYGWNAFLTKFLNIQSNRFISGDEILLLGQFNFSELQNSNDSLEELRKNVSLIDEQVSSLVKMIAKAGKTPIIIGGGHNNAYGALKGCSEAFDQRVNCINLDPHADYRALEGRHSGNGFSYARAEGYLNQYSIVGLHENYNSENMLRELSEQQIHYSTFEDIFIREKLTFEAATKEALEKIWNAPYGIELDCDSIIDFPSSAQTPSGVHPNQARKYVHQTASHKNVCYFHLPEAAPSLQAVEAGQVGKLMAYLVSDFIKAQLNL